VVRPHQRQRLDGVLALAAQAKRLTAGHEYPHARTPPHEAGDERGSLHDLLEIVDEQQNAPKSQVIPQAIDHRAAA
jgi:hypothetical protein